MSDLVTIKIITDTNNNSAKELRIGHDTNMTLMSTLLGEGLVSGSFCGGRGSCKRCRVRFVEGAPLPVAADRNAFSPDELRLGFRLACMARPKDDCVICLEFINDRRIDVVTEASGPVTSDTQKASKSAAAVSSRDGTCSEIDQNNQNGYIIAVDLGTTTIAMQLAEFESGRVVDSYCAMNPQRSFGVDVLSRVRAANEGHADKLRNSVWQVISDGVKTLIDGIGREKTSRICCVCVAGNTVMAHLLMGLSTEGLGKSPFTPVTLGLQKCALKINEYEIPVYIMPGISAFVGGDITAGLYHCGMLGLAETEAEKGEDGAVLFIDLGTNGEMAIEKGGRIITAAAAAGPAFEGALAVGSDVIRAAAYLLEKGILDKTGLLAEQYFEEGVDVAPDPDLSGKAAIHITKEDIRALQMAKAAVRAGIDILCEKIKAQTLDCLYLAGGFGYYLDIESAAVIGLIPDRFKASARAVGNTSLAGVFEIGRDLYSGSLAEKTLVKRLEAIESVNLANEESFNSRYLGYLNFP